jgi:hypothetical protein
VTAGASTVAARRSGPRRALRPWCLAGLAGVLLSAACGYSLAGRASTLDPSIKVIQFQTLTNLTSLSGVEQRLSGAIARELAARGHFRVQSSPDGADADLTGAVTRFDFYPVAFDSEGRATQYQVAVTARVALKSLPEGKSIWENPAYTFRENYSFAAGAGSYVDRQNETIDKVADKFAQSLVASLLEGF